MSAAKAQQQLDPGRFLRERRIGGTHTLAEWLACLGPLAQGRQPAGWLPPAGWAIAALAAGVAFLGFQAGGAGIAIGIAGAIIAVMAGALAIVNGRRKVPAAVSTCVVPLLVALREDMGRDQPLTMHLDLTGPEQRRKVAGGRGSGNGTPGTVERRYVDRWFSGAARLADGSRLNWEVTDYLRRRDETRKRRSGKTKTKAKYKLTRHLTVRLGLPRERYAATSAGAQGDRGLRVAVKPGERRDVIKLRRILTIRGREATIAADQLLDLIGQAYGQAAPAARRLR